MTYKLTALEVNALTGETTIRPLTAEELAEREAMQAEQQAQLAEQEEKEKARESALAKLAALGLTEEEIAAL
jgi:DNA-binding NarL/FixJ family response regulator